MLARRRRAGLAIRRLDVRTGVSPRAQRHLLERPRALAVDDPLQMGRLLVMAPHPDDEVLGAGGTIARLSAAGAEVVVAVVTKGAPPLFATDAVARVRTEAEAAHAYLGVSRTVFLEHPAARLDEVPHHELNRAFGALLREVAPDALLLPFPGDMHLDHQLTFLSSLVAARPHGAGFPGRILCYETLSETNWNAPFMAPSFMPNVFVDISAQLERKLEAMRLYGSQQREFPHERSLPAIRALAMFRGSTVHREAAEAFMLVRQVV